MQLFKSVTRNQLLIRSSILGASQVRVFNTKAPKMPIDDTGLMDVGEIFKTKYYVEFD